MVDIYLNPEKIILIKKQSVLSKLIKEYFKPQNNVGHSNIAQ